jgi:protein tyrosine/serine phosphatase
MKKIFLLALSLAVFICPQAFAGSAEPDFRLSKNFHEIEPGTYYRSAQLTKKEFASAINKYHIRTIVNLRGESPKEKWYRDEVAVTSENNVALFSIGMSAGKIPHKANVVKLLDIFKTAERPMLVHCQAGADRTGEASAIYQMLYMNKSKEEALKMLTPKYFHIPKAKPAKRYFIKLFEGEEWVRNTYNPCLGQYKYYNVNTPFCKSPE